MSAKIDKGKRLKEVQNYIKLPSKMKLKWNPIMVKMKNNTINKNLKNRNQKGKAQNTKEEKEGQ